MSSLIERIKKNSTIKESDVIADSKFLNDKDLIQTSVPAVNVALSGKLDGGLTPGLTVFAGPSKHFKTAFAMLLAKAYLDKYEEKSYERTIKKNLANSISQKIILRLAVIE